jgi:hypothetical protein
MSPRAKKEPKTEEGTTPKGTFKEVLKRDNGQCPIIKFMSPKNSASKVERTIREQETTAKRIDLVV